MAAGGRAAHHRHASGAATAGQRGVWDRLADALKPGAYRPRLRAELVQAAQHRSRAGEPYVVVKNRARPAYLRLTAREYALLELMDGTRSVSDLVVEYLLRYRVLAFQRVVSLVHRLGQHGFLDRAAVDPERGLRDRFARRDRLGRWLRLVGGWLAGREVVVEGVGHLVDRWYRRWGRLLFTRWAQLLFAAVATTGLGLFALGLWRGSQRLLIVGDSYALGVLFLLAFGLAATGIHELGHALALRHVGCEVRRAGLLFYYGVPTFFVDTTDTWMAGPGARLAVSWAGPYTALIQGGVASIAGALVPGGVVGDLLFAWAFVSYLDVLVNLNPLLELDGYYLLVDALERPLLRRHALRFARVTVWRKLWRREALSGEEKLLALFGLASGVWSLFSIWLALYLWGARLQGMVGELWRSGSLGSRLALALLAGAAAAALVVALARAARDLAPRLVARATLLHRRGEAVRRRETVALLRRLPFLADLPAGRLLETAALLQPVYAPSGEEVVRQGELGTRFYLVKRGCLDVIKDGELVATLGAGTCFGEIALLRNVARTATVRARTASHLLAMRGDDFRALLAHEMDTFLRLQTRVELRDELGRLPWLAGLGPAELDLLLAKLEPTRFPPGACLVRQGERGDRFYVIRAGQVAVETNGAQVSLLGPGDYCGEIALLLDVPRTATLRAVGPQAVEAWSLGRDDFVDVLGQYLGLAPALQETGTRRLGALGAR